jgi:hypothetical protein
VDITFEELELRELCESVEDLREKLGEDGARGFLVLLSDIESSRSIAELGELYPLNFSAGDSLFIELDALFTTEFVNGSVVSDVELGSLTDWTTVWRLRLVRLEP